MRQIGFNINGHGSHDLPLDLLPGVLQHVNQTDRLCRCAVVSRKWYHAVNMASTSISCILNTRKDFEGLSAWLCSNNYANKINTVEAQAHKIFSKAYVKTKPVLKLPIATLQQLRSLKLSYCSVVVASGGAGDDTNASAAAGTVAAIPELLSLAALTALRGLELEGTVLDLSELSSCTGLQHLALSHVGHLARTATSAANKVIEQAEERSAVGHFPTLIASALYQLTQLTYCSLMYGPYVHSTDRDKLAAEVGAALSNLQQLKELQLGLSWYYASEIAKLPTTLTALHLIGEPKLAWREPMPQLTHFQQLQRLQYGCAECRGAFNLSALTKLTWLDLSNCWFQLDSAVDDLLADIQKLEQLKHLVLSGSLGEEAVPAAGYAALTASKHLTFLDLTNNIFYLDNIEFIFVRENPCVALATLITGSDLFLTPGCFDRLAACCPALQQLEIRDQSGEDPGTFDNQGLSALSNLTALTKISIKEVMRVSNVAIRGLAACNQLRELVLHMPVSDDKKHRPVEDAVNRAGLMQLTQLTALSRLSVTAELQKSAFRFDDVSARPPYDTYLRLQQALRRFTVARH